MKSAFLVSLNDNWSLGYDQNQWMIRQRRKRGDKTYWQPVSFIATKKALLWRNLHEMGVLVTPGAKAEIDSWPDTFKEWFKHREVRDINPLIVMPEAAE